MNPPSTNIGSPWLPWWSFLHHCGGLRRCPVAFRGFLYRPCARTSCRRSRFESNKSVFSESEIYQQARPMEWPQRSAFQLNILAAASQKPRLVFISHTKPNDAPSVWKKLCHTPRCSLILKVGKSWPQAGETVRKWRNTYYLIRHRSRFTAVPLSIAFVASIDGPIGFSAAAFLSGNPQISGWHFILTVTHVDCSSLEGKRMFFLHPRRCCLGWVLEQIHSAWNRWWRKTPLYHIWTWYPWDLKPGRYIIGKLHSICFLAVVLILSQSLRKMERKLPDFRVVCEWRKISVASEEGKGQRQGHRGVSCIDKGTVSTLCPLTCFIVGLG